MASVPLGVHVSQGARSGSMVASKARRAGAPGLPVSVGVSRLLLLLLLLLACCQTLFFMDFA